MQGLEGVYSTLASILIINPKHNIMEKEKFNYLIGKTRNQIKKEIGDGFNYFENEIWTYELGKTWFGRKTILSITFKEEKASTLHLYKTFGRC